MSIYCNEKIRNEVISKQNELTLRINKFNIFKAMHSKRQKRQNLHDLHVKIYSLL